MAHLARCRPHGDPRRMVLDVSHSRPPCRRDGWPESAAPLLRHVRRQQGPRAQGPHGRATGCLRPHGQQRGQRRWRRRRAQPGGRWLAGSLAGGLAPGADVAAQPGVDRACSGAHAVSVGHEPCHVRAGVQPSPAGRRQQRAVGQDGAARAAELSPDGARAGSVARAHAAHVHLGGAQPVVDEAAPSDCDAEYVWADRVLHPDHLPLDRRHRPPGLVALPRALPAVLHALRVAALDDAHLRPVRGLRRPARRDSGPRDLRRGHARRPPRLHLEAGRRATAGGGDGGRCGRGGVVRVALQLRKHVLPDLDAHVAHARRRARPCARRAKVIPRAPHVLLHRVLRGVQGALLQGAHGARKAVARRRAERGEAHGRQNVCCPRARPPAAAQRLVERVSRLASAPLPQHARHRQTRAPRTRRQPPPTAANRCQSRASERL
mmetsp:Transcript_30443/g.78967  ORF Transcript_30443/g.78967 Transcript_30443/m.78967 type:complete len:435 (-) Transcript_30443:773-2077(-)